MADASETIENMSIEELQKEVKLGKRSRFQRRKMDQIEDRLEVLLAVEEESSEESSEEE